MQWTLRIPALRVLLLPWFVGLVVGGFQMELTLKPVSYCLPGHRVTMRRILFSVGTALGLLAGLPFISWERLRTGQFALTLCSAFSAALLCYWFGVVMFWLGRSVIFLFPPIVVAAVLCVGKVSLAQLLASRPVHFMVPGVLATAGMWRLLGSSALARRFCGANSKLLFQTWFPWRALSKGKRSTKPKGIFRGALSSRALRFFVARMDRCSDQQTLRYVWGGLYRGLTQMLSKWKRAVLLNVFLIPVFLLPAWYLLPGAVAWVLLFMMESHAFAARLPVQSAMLISGGRRERFWVAASAAIGGGVMILVGIVVTVAAVELLRPYMPEFKREYMTFSIAGYSVLDDLRVLCGAPAIIAVAYTVQLLFFDTQVKPAKVPLAIPLSELSKVVLFSGIFTLSRLGLPSSILGLALLTCGAWGGFFLLLRHVCMKRHMVGEDRRWHRWGWVATLGCLALLPACLYWFEYGATRELRIELAAIRAAGEPAEWQDLEMNAVPYALNAAPLYVKAVEVLPLKEYPPFDERLPTRWDRLADMLGYLYWRADYRREHQAEVDEILTGAQEALALCRRAGGLERSYWKRDPPVSMIDLDRPALSRPRPLANTLALAAVVAHEAGDDREALRYTRDCLKLAESAGAWPGVFGHMARVGLEYKTYSAVETIAPALRVGSQPLAASRDQVRGLIAMFLDDRQFNEGFTRAMMAERCSAYEHFKLMRRKYSVLALGGASAVIRVTRSNGAYVLASRQDSLDKARALFPPKPEPEKPRHASLMHIYDMFFDLFEKDSQDLTFLAHYLGLAERRLMATALAIRLYELDHGRRPETLDQLVPEYLPAVPIDPLAADGRRMCYRPDADSPVVYSVGPDQADNGGVLVFSESDPGEIDEDSSDAQVFLNDDRPQGEVDLPEVDLKELDDADTESP